MSINDTQKIDFIIFNMNWANIRVMWKSKYHSYQSHIAHTVTTVYTHTFVWFRDVTCLYVFQQWSSMQSYQWIKILWKLSLTRIKKATAKIDLNDFAISKHLFAENQSISLFDVFFFIHNLNLIRSLKSATLVEWNLVFFCSQVLALKTIYSTTPQLLMNDYNIRHVVIYGFFFAEHRTQNKLYLYFAVRGIDTSCRWRNFLKHETRTNTSSTFA